MEDEYTLYSFDCIMVYSKMQNLYEKMFRARQEHPTLSNRHGTNFQYPIGTWSWALHRHQAYLCVLVNTLLLSPLQYNLQA